MSIREIGSTDSTAVLVERFLTFAEVELNFATESIIKYRDCLLQIERLLGAQPVESVTKDDVLQLKQSMLRKQMGVSRQVSILATLKRFLSYCRTEQGMECLDPAL